MTNQNDQSKTISKGRFLIQEIVVKTDENLIDHERLRRTKHLSLCKRIYHKSFNFENRKYTTIVKKNGSTLTMLKHI